MPFRPNDGNQVPDEAITALEEHKPIEKIADGSEAEPTPETKVEEKKEEKVPYHQDPAVQLYIERQIAKRSGESKTEFNARLDRLEQALTKPKDEATRIGDWTPANPNDAKAARAIIAQAKREFLAELQQADAETKKEVEAGDNLLKDWFDELTVVGILKDEDDKRRFAKLIADYKLEDKDAAVALWGRLGDEIRKAQEEGEEEGIKKATEAKVGSSRKSAEPGTREKTYAERRTQEPNFDAILDREMARLGY